MRMETISIAIDDRTLESLDELVELMDCSRSTFVRFLIDNYIKGLNKNVNGGDA